MPRTKAQLETELVQALQQKKQAEETLVSFKSTLAELVLELAEEHEWCGSGLEDVKGVLTEAFGIEFTEEYIEVLLPVRFKSSQLVRDLRGTRELPTSVQRDIQYYLVGALNEDDQVLFGYSDSNARVEYGFGQPVKVTSSKNDTWEMEL